MRLISIRYSQYLNQNNEWKLDHTDFGHINLIIGKNASGKSRTINILSGLAGLLSGKRKPTLLSANYEVSFLNEKNENIDYVLYIDDSQVVKESLVVDGKAVLQRDSTGRGKIFAVQLGADIDFQTPLNELTSSVRRDDIQHPFFNDLYVWANSVCVYQFGTPLGKDQMILSSEGEDNNFSSKNEITTVVEKFRDGEMNFGKKFVDVIIKDMKLVGYNLEEIGVEKPTSFVAKINLLGLYVKEKDLVPHIDQQEMSQGMFRALSLVTQLNYSLLKEQSSCVIIDDIGEGLDFERSTNLINLLINKSEKKKLQLIMSTNDRFVMNNVPLEYWSIVQRTKNGKGSKLLNYKNSKEIFDEFRFTGLNNFDFFSKDYFSKKGF